MGDYCIVLATHNQTSVLAKITNSLWRKTDITQTCVSQTNINKPKYMALIFSMYNVVFIRKTMYVLVTFPWPRFGLFTIHRK